MNCRSPLQTLLHLLFLSHSRFNEIKSVLLSPLLYAFENLNQIFHLFVGERKILLPIFVDFYFIIYFLPRSSLEINGSEFFYFGSTDNLTNYQLLKKKNWIEREKLFLTRILLQILLKEKLRVPYELLLI